MAEKPYYHNGKLYIDNIELKIYNNEGIGKAEVFKELWSLFLGSKLTLSSIKSFEEIIITKVVKKLPRYKSEKELYNKACNFDDSAISGSERKVLEALIGLSANYRWDLYLALSEFIDGFLW